MEEFQTIVDGRGRVLRAKSRTELLTLQDSPTENVEIDGQPGTIDLIVEEEPQGSLRVVVQGFIETNWFPRLGVKNVALDGFRMNPEGTISEFHDEEFYEFD